MFVILRAVVHRQNASTPGFGIITPGFGVHLFQSAHYLAHKHMQGPISISEVSPPYRPMAKKESDSFFIRAAVNHGTASSFTEATIDMGAFVDALGKSVVRIHNCQVQIVDEDEYEKGPIGTTNSQGLNIRYQLTTQTQTDLVRPDDKSLVASGNYLCQFGSGNQVVQLIDNVFDLGPQEWTNGYLIAVDNLYLGCDHDTGEASTDGYFVCIVLECTVEKMDERASMALALSQQ
jgi:hypothetical protein